MCVIVAERESKIEVCGKPNNFQMHFDANNKNLHMNVAACVSLPINHMWRK